MKPFEQYALYGSNTGRVSIEGDFNTTDLIEGVEYKVRDAEEGIFNGRPEGKNKVSNKEPVKTIRE